MPTTNPKTKAAPDANRVMKAIYRRGGIERVSVDYFGHGFIARCFPSASIARQRVIEAAEKEGLTSLFLDELSARIEHACTQQIAYGEGATIQDALVALQEKLG
jgi:hypothetical protein